jgi:hypothetical protein
MRRIDSHAANKVRDLVDEYYYLRRYEDILRDPYYGDASEGGLIELNQFIQWLGAKKPIGRYPLGWGNVKNRCIGRRRETSNEIKAKAREIEKSLRLKGPWCKPPKNTARMMIPQLRYKRNETTTA